jgi:hypothetical protein
MEDEVRCGENGQGGLHSFMLFKHHVSTWCSRCRSVRVEFAEPHGDSCGLGRPPKQCRVRSESPWGAYATSVDHRRDVVHDPITR